MTGPRGGGFEGRCIVTGSLAAQERIRGHMTEARDQVRRRRTEVMAEVGRMLRDWRGLNGILQQDLAAEGCVSATVVRRIEKGDYESPPPESLIAAVARQGGPARELQDLARAFQELQGRQKKIDKLLARKVLPDVAGEEAIPDEQLAQRAGLADPARPAPPVLFAGRQRELGHLGQLLDRNRLVTVTGPGGIGKTALCLRFAGSGSALAGPWFADLSRYRDGEPLLPPLARLILDEDDGSGSDEQIVARLRTVLGDLPALIIFDNCEHLAAAAAAAVTALLDACTSTSVLATSREPLHLPGEAVLTLGPLPIIDPQAAPGQPTDAAGLFTALLGNARGDENPDPGQAAVVQDLCRKLDGIPLCIELAAARARTLPLRDIADSVGRSAAILSGGRKDVPRHQAIEAAIRWSWDLLTPQEQQGLSRLAILTAPFTYGCGIRIAADDLDLGEHVVATLADKSLLSRTSNDAGDARFTILGVVRAFAAAQLRAPDRQHAVDQLMSWALGITSIDEAALGEPGTIERLDADLPLIRVALESSDSPADQVRLALVISPYWQIRSQSAYACRFLVKALRHDIQLTPAERGKALGALADMLAYQGHYEESVSAAEASIGVRRTLGDPAQLRNGLLTLLGALLETRQVSKAERCLAEIAQLPGEPDQPTRGDILVRHAVLYLHRGDPHRAVQLLQDAARCFSDPDTALAHGFCLGNLSVAYRKAGDLEASLHSALTAKERIGARYGPGCEAEMTVAVAAAYIALGRHHDALAELDAATIGDDARVRTRLHALTLRAMAASAASPSAAAAFLLQHTDDFSQPASPHDDRALLFLSAVQDIAYRKGAHSIAERLAAIHAKLAPASGDITLSPPASGPSFQLTGLRPEPRVAGAGSREHREALDIAAAALTDLASAQHRTSPTPALAGIGTAGTRMPIPAPHSRASA